MKPKSAFLALAALLLSANAFAAEQAKSVVTIQVAGKTVATVSLDEQPKGSQMSLSADSKNTTIVYDPQKGVTTIKGKFIFEVKQGEKTLWRIAVEDGVGTVQLQEPAPAATPPTATTFSLPGEHPGTFCGQAEVNRMVLNTEAGKEMQRQQQDAIRRSQATVAAPAQPTPTPPQK